MQLGVLLPVSRRSRKSEALTRAAQQAEQLGFNAVWSADWIVTQWDIRTPYPYRDSGEFIVLLDRPFWVR